jgi:3,4-dihydroxy 2-butanone 4-phosphate synthase/GTP cyclohydrolase II
LIDRELGQTMMVAAADAVTIGSLVIMTRHGGGLLKVILPADRFEGRVGVRCSDGVTVDLRGHSAPGSAADRLATIRALADQASDPAALLTPGHVAVQSVGVENGDLRGVSLRLTAASGACLACPLAGESEGSQDDRVVGLARRLRLRVLDLASARAELASESVRLRRRVEAQVPTPRASYRALGYADASESNEHIALVLGDPTERGFRVHAHRRCVSDVFVGDRCSCGTMLRESLAEIEAVGSGAVIYSGELDAGWAEHLERPALEAGEQTPEQIADILLDLGASSISLSSNLRIDESRLTSLGLALISQDDGAHNIVGTCA